ncbi:MAG: hypothetical protein ACWA6U_18215 [Breznakibacter sp.]
MDYANGTELWKYQWDLIHNPETILLGAYNEEEGALKGVTPYDKILNVMEMIRCAYKSGRSVKFVKDTWGWVSESVGVKDFSGLYDGVTYDYLFVQLKDDSNLITIPSNLDFESNSNIVLDLVYGETVKFDFGDLIIIVDKAHAHSLKSYLKPTDMDYGKQLKEFINKLSAAQTRQKTISILSVSSQCFFEYLTQEQRIHLLKIINDGSNIPDIVERVVIDIIRTTPEGQIEYLFEHLVSDGLMAYFDKVINDINGEDYYTRFIIELMKLYRVKYSKELEDCFKVNEWGSVYMKMNTGKVDFGRYSFISNVPMPFYEWSKGCDVPSWRYVGNNIQISSSCGYFNNVKPQLKPFEPVVICFSEELPFFKVSNNERIIAMPAFVLPWLRNKALATKGADLINNAITIADACMTLGEGSLAVKGVSKGVLIAWKYFIKANSVIELLLVNDNIKKGIQNIGTSGEGKALITWFGYYNNSFEYLAKPVIEKFALKQSTSDVLANYIDIQKTWQLIVKSTDIDKYLDEDQQSELTLFFEKTIEALKNENDVVE